MIMRSLAFDTDDDASPALRAVTGACYTLPEDTRVDNGGRRFRTASAGLPVVAHADGSCTSADTPTRRVRVVSSG
jgi:hypothetical protein